MSDPDPRQTRDRTPIEVEPPVLGRFAIWIERSRLFRTSVDAARSRHSSIDLGLTIVERDASIGGGLLAGALAYRLFVLLLPVALLFVSGIGLYADAADKSADRVAKDAGLQGLIASQVASTASGGARWIVFMVMLPAVLYALAKLYRAIAVTHAIAWHGSGRGVRVTGRGLAAVGAALLANVAAAEAVGWIRRQNGLGGLSALLVYLVVVGGAWLIVSIELPRRETTWSDLLPGALLLGGGLLFVNVFNVYVTTRLVEGRADTYGALGIAAALLFSLVLVGRLIVLSAELNAALDERRAGRRRPSA
ncbi:MAG TPA: YhjD/YihY/BrkB family envelope integrity protein [Gaiellaceae bacterium]|nr:YhjD/YihY/BrkB family envelope integrity protein [Gaiellaceae bacterium]